jgi:hypothetical protein
MLAAPVALRRRAGQREEGAMRLTLQRWGVWRAWQMVAWLLPLLAWLPMAAQAQIDPGSAERLLRKSGLWVQLDGVAQQVRQGMVEAAAQSGRTPAPGESERLEAAATAAYAVDRLRGVALRTVSQELQSSHLKALFAWYDAPTGVLMTKLEEQSAGDSRDSAVVMADGLARLQAMSATRRGHIEALVQASGSVETALSMTLNTVAGVRQGMAGVLPPGDGPSPEATRALLAEQLPKLRPAFEQLVRAISAVAYASADDAQLAEYVAFLRSPAGLHLSEVMNRVLDAAFLDGATELGRRLAPAAGVSA